MEKYVRKTSQLAITKSLFITIIVVSSLSCSKVTQEEAVSNAVDKEKSKIDLILDQTLLPLSIENNTFVFSSEESFQETVDFLVSIGDDNFDAFEEYYGFSSFRRSVGFSEFEEKADPLLASLLNTNSDIIIGPHKFTLDFDKEMVIARLIKSTDDSVKSVVATEAVFDFDDDVFALIEGDADSKKVEYCSGGEEDNEYYSLCILPDPDGMWMKVRYYNSGILHALCVLFRPSDLGGYAITKGFYTNTDESFWSNVDNTNVKMNVTESGNSLRDIVYRPYNRSKRLTNFYLNVNFWVTNHNTGITTPFLLTISCR